MVTIPSLPNHILLVVGTGPDKQMLGIDAQSHVAFMTNIMGAGNFAPKYKPRCAMGANEFPLDESNRAVAAIHSTASPQPTPFSNFGLCEKTFLQGTRLGSSLTALGAIEQLPVRVFKTPSWEGENFSANNTIPSDTWNWPHSPVMPYGGMSVQG